MTNSIEEKSERLRQIVNDLGITQKKIAENLGMSSIYLNSIINGYKDLSGSFLEKFSAKYGHRYNVGWLLSGNGEMLLIQPEKAPDEKSLKDRLNDLEQRVSRLEEKQNK